MAVDDQIVIHARVARPESSAGVGPRPSQSLMACHPVQVQVEHLPVWWRCLLVAVATLILCSCSSPALRTHLSADKSLLEPAHAPIAADRRPTALPGVSGSGVVAGTPNEFEPTAEPGAACTCNGGPTG